MFNCLATGTGEPEAYLHAWGTDHSRGDPPRSEWQGAGVPESAARLPVDRPGGTVRVLTPPSRYRTDVVALRLRRRTHWARPGDFKFDLLGRNNNFVLNYDQHPHQGLQVMFDRRHPGGPGLHLR